MEFEEFFKKKRIDLVALKQVQSALFSEFETHFIQMGEKSFDHTKKYWFNKLRREFPLAVEPKLEKVKIDNPLAEQTITESLIEETAPAPKLGFTPKFRAASPSKPATEPSTEEKPAEATNTPAPKLGFTPKFKASAPPKPATEEASAEKKPAEPVAAPAPKLGFTPKFKAATPPKPIDDTPPVTNPEESTPQPPAEEEASKPVYKPRFKMQNLPKKEEE
jgi:hypothetical protein